ncbi:phage head-tail joining family protein [Pediococcus claussenii ATCC BAA-344]|uniref:Phage head-tail joining family protein n=2 Tax=Pediococcus claussenii TaxID=187452 RepID=G8PCA7_PEDCP|nr:phage head-tail joining family protein [Pediococcus claussenii ATCC BAA-344]KRN18804.1 hypothetical protein IV79_GL000355 [Pediococcus claussenii]
MTVNQSVNVTGRLVEAERMIVIRHNKQVNDQLLANLDGKLYTIISINSDDDLNAFDVLALKNYRGIKV